MPRFTQADVYLYNAKRAKAGVTPKPLPRGEVKEKEIQGQISAYLRSFGSDCHFDVCRMDKATTGQLGRPDFLIALRGVGLAIEVKRPSGKVSREQAGSLLLWKLAGFHVAVVHNLAEAVEFVTGVLSERNTI